MSKGTTEELWLQLVKWLDTHAPRLAAELALPATNEQLSEAEARVGRPLPESLRRILQLHNGGDGVIGGWDLMSASEIAHAYGAFLEYAESRPPPLWMRALSDAGMSRNWFPFVATPGGDYICVDVEPGPCGHVGQVFLWRHDDDPSPPVAASLDEWLERALAALERGDLQYDSAREEWVPMYRSLGFDQAYDTKSPRFDSTHATHELVGPVEVRIWAVDGAQPLRPDIRIVMLDGDRVLQTATLADLMSDERESDGEECDEEEGISSQYSIFLGDSKKKVARITGRGRLRVEGLVEKESLWLHTSHTHPDEIAYRELWDRLVELARDRGSADRAQIATVLRYGEILDTLHPSVLERRLDFAASSVHLGSAFAPLLRAGANTEIVATARKFIATCSKTGYKDEFNEYFVMNLLCAATRLDRTTLADVMSEALRLPCSPSGQVYFNAACCFAKLGRKHDCLAYVRLARRHGVEPNRFYEDPDFSDVRGDPDFRAATDQST